MAYDADKVKESYRGRSLNSYQSDKLRANAVNSLEKFKANNPDLIIPTKQTPQKEFEIDRVNNSTALPGAADALAGYDARTYEPKSMDTEEFLQVAGNKIYDGVTETASGVNSGLATFMGAAAVKNAWNYATNQPLQSTASVIKDLNKLSGVDEGRKWVADNKTKIEVRKEAQLAAIMSNPNIGELEKAKQAGAFYLKNPDMLALETVKVTTQSAAEMAFIYGKVGAAAGIANPTIRAATAAGASDTNNSLSQYVQEGREIDGRTVTASLAKGAVTGLTTGAFAAAFPHHSLDRILVGGGTRQFTIKGAVANSLKTGATEAPEEFIQGLGEGAIDRFEKGQSITDGTLAEAVVGGILGFGAGTLSTSTGVAGAAGRSSVAGVNKVIAANDTRKRGTLEENMDLENEKSDPTRAYKQIVFNTRSDDPAVRDKADKQLTDLSSAMYGKLAEYDAVIENAGNEEAKASLIQERDIFDSTVMQPFTDIVQTTVNAEIASKEETTKNILTQLNASSDVMRTEAAARKVAAATEQEESDYTAPTVKYNGPVGGSQNTSGTVNSNATSKSGTSRAPSVGLANIINQKAAKHGVSTALIDAIIKQESGFKVNARNTSSGASGLMQLIPKTAQGLGVRNIMDADQNIEGGTKYIKQMLTKYKGNTSLALMAYNWGPGNVDKYLASVKAGKPITIPTETRNYLKSVTTMMNGQSSTGTSSVRDPTKYIKYDNANATRSHKLDTKVEQSLGFLQDMGISFRVNSGGQDATGSKRVGSTAHNHGHAGDGDLYIGNRKLDWDKPADKAIFEKVIEEAAANGINGFGLGYMGKGRVHFGIQNNAASWGSGGNASTPGYSWVNEAIKRGKARAPSVSSSGPGNTRRGAFTVDGLMNPIKVGVEDAPIDDSSEATKEEVLATTPEEAKNAEVRKVGMRATRNHYSSLSAEEIDNHPLLNDKQKAALRQMSDVKRKAASETNLNEVSKTIREGKQGATTVESDMGTKQYESVVNLAIANNDGRTAKRYLSKLDNFTENQISKAKVIEENIDTATKATPLYVAPNTKGIWETVSAETAMEPEFKQSGGLAFWSGRNSVSDAIVNDAVYLSEFRDALTNTAAALVDGIKPIPTSKAVSPIDVVSVGPLIDTSTVAGTSSTTPTATPLVFDNKDTASTTTVPTETPVVGEVIKVEGKSGTKIEKLYEHAETVEEATDGIFLGRGPDKKSMSNVKMVDDKLQGVGEQGWLAQPYNKGTREENMDKYVKAFKSRFGKHDEFVEGVLGLKDKKLYAHPFTAEVSETNFINELIQNIPSDLKEAKAFVNNIEGYNKDGIIYKNPPKVVTVDPTTPQTSTSAPVESETVSETTAPVTTQEATVSTEGTVNDDTFGFNKKNQYGLNTVTDNSLAANKANIDKVIADLGDPSKVVIPSSGLGANLATIAPRTFKYLNEQLEAIYKVNNVELIAKAPRKKVEGRSAFGKTDSRSKQGVASNPIEALGLNLDPEVVVTIDVTEVNNLESNLELYTKLQPGLISDKEIKLHTSIIGPLLNFNPNLTVQLTTEGTTAYDSEANLIKINMSEEGFNILETITELVIASSTENVANELEGKKNSDMVTEPEDLIQLNKDLADIKRQISALVSDENPDFMALSDKAKARLVNGLESNAEMLRLLTADLEIGDLLRSVKSKGEKTNNSVFRKITNTLRSFFNIAPRDEIATLYDKLLEATSRTATIQAKDNKVKFEFNKYGKASIFQDVIPAQIEVELAKPFKERNHLLAGFTQSSTKGKPLTSVSNLSSKLKLDIMQGLGILNTKAPTVAQRKQIQDFLNFNDEFQVHIRDTFNRKGRSKDGVVDFAYEDLKGFLGTANENTLTAVSLGVYSWAIEYGSGNLSPDKTIKKFLNAKEEDDIFVPPYVRAQYEYMTDLKGYVTDKIGQTIIGALDIKATGELEATAQSNLQNSLGEWGVSAMQSANLIHIETMSTDDHVKNIELVGTTTVNAKGESTFDHNDKGSISFISLSGAKGDGKNARMDEIASLSKNTVGYMDTVFGTEIGLRAPVTEKPTKLIIDQKRTVAKTGKFQAKFMKKMQEEPISIDVDMLNGLKVLMSVSRDSALEMIGAHVSEEDLAKEHKEDRHSVQAAAEGIMRDYENGMDFIGSLETNEDGSLQEFYDQVYAAKNNRMHYNSNMFNFQSSLLHRAIGQYSNFKTEVNINEDVVKANGDLSHYALFMKSIAEQAEGTEDYMEAALKGTPYTMGFTQDKIPGDVFVPIFENYLQTDKTVLAAVEATKVLLKSPEDLSQEQVAAISKLVKEWKMKAGSLRALIEYTKFVVAKESGATSITTSMGLGSDGVNNGIALANVILGTANQSFLNQVGMYTKTSPFNNYYQSRTDKTVKDYYENFSTVVTTEIAGLTNTYKGLTKDGKVPTDKKGNKLEVVPNEKALERLNTLLALNTSFKGRKNMKAILIPFGYSAGMKRLKQLAYGQFLADIKSTMKSIAKEGENSETEHLKLKQNLEALLGHEIDLPTGKGILDFWFEFKDVKALEALYIDAVGDVVQSSLESYAGEFMKTRDLNIRMQNVAADAYLRLSGVVKQQAIAAYQKDHNITDAQFLLEGMPTKYYDEYLGKRLDALRPTIKAPLNHKTGEKESNFVVLNERNKMAAGKGNSKTNRVNEDGDLVATTTPINVSTRVEESAGVGPNSSQVQGMDAYIAARTSADGGTVNINIHDAGISGFNNFKDMVLEQNKATYEGLRDYSSQSESFAALVDIYTQFTAMVEDGSVPESVLREELDLAFEKIYGKRELKVLTTTGLKDSDGKDVVLSVKDKQALLLNILTNRVAEADRKKLAIIESLESVHQYAGENGEYQVPTNDKTAIEASRASQEASRAAMPALIAKLGEINSKLAEGESVVKEKGTKSKTYDLGAYGDNAFNPKDSNMDDNRILADVFRAEAKGTKKQKLNFYKSLWRDYLQSFPFLYDQLVELSKDHTFTSKGSRGDMNTALVLQQIVDEGLTGFRHVTDMETEIKSVISEANAENIQIADIQTNLLAYVMNIVSEVNPELTISFRNTQSYGLTKSGKSIAGFFNNVMNHITFNEDMLKGMSKEGQVALIAHELLHSVNIGNIMLDKKNQNNPAIKELSRMREELLAVRNKERRDQDIGKNTSEVIDSALEDISEMISYGLTDPNIMAWMGNHLVGNYTSKVDNRRSFLDAFIENVKAFFSTANWGGMKINPKGIENFMKMIDLAEQIATKLTEQERKDAGFARNKNSYSTQSNTPTQNLKAMSNGNTSPKFSAHLDGLNEKVLGGFYEGTNERKADIDAVMTKVDTKALKAGFTLSDKEMYTHDAIKAVAKSYLDAHGGKKVVQELNKLFHLATSQLTYKSFLTTTNPTPQEIATAKKKVAYIMDQRGKNKEEQFERFFSLALASEEFNNALKTLDSKAAKKEDANLLDRVMGVFADMINWLTEKVYSTKGLDIPDSINTLFNRLSEIDLESQNRQEHMIDKTYSVIVGAVLKPTSFVTTKLYGAIMPQLDFSESNFSSLRAMARYTKKVHKGGGIMGQVEQMVDNSAALNPSGRISGSAEILNELTATKGMKQTVEGQIRMVQKAAQDRDTVLKKTKSAILKNFTKGGKDLETKELNSMTTVGLRSDISSLMNHGFNVTRVLKLLQSKPERLKEVVKLENRILAKENGNDMVMQTKSLALYMAREVAVEHMVKNAEGIATGLGSWYQTDISNMDINLRNDIDALASLYAVDMAPNEDIATLSSLIDKEYEGVKATLQFHKDLSELSKSGFDDNRFNYSKGYVPQDTHHLRSLKFVSSQEERTALISRGWDEVTESGLVQDMNDKTLPKSLMFHNDMVYQNYVSGALDMKDTHSKGTEVYNVRQNRTEMRTTQASKLAARQRRANLPHAKFNPFTSSSNTMVAGYDSEGQVTSYSYEMTGHMRDTYLDRNNNGIDLLGMHNSDLLFKPKIKETQTDLAKALRTDYVDNYKDDPRKFVVLSPNSKDPNILAMWRMMPYAFKVEAEALFGKGQPITVRSNVYNAVFGFKQYSLSEMFEKVTGDKNALELILTNLATAVFKDKAQMRVIQGERVWKGTVSQIKDFIVIRNVDVLWSNVVSNALILSLHGVKPVQQGKDLVSVWANGKKYRKQAARIIEIDVELAVNRSRAGNISELKRERTLAELEMKRNPLHEFMEAGLMSTIVEDVQVGKEDTAFKSEFDKQLEKVSDNIPQAIKTTFNWAIMSPGTPLHTFMASATQYSDLAAKYTLATHLMREGKSMEDAIAVAQDNFINYDVPTSRELDYANSVGLFMFTKFFLRFQQVLLSRLNANATGVVMQHLAVEHFTGADGVLDPFAINRLGNNPFKTGAFGYGDAFNNITSVKVITGILD